MESTSESDSDAELLLLCGTYYMLKKQKSRWKSNYMKRRQTYGEYILTSEFSDDTFTNYFRCNRSQFEEIHNFVQNEIHSEGCNAQVPRSREKLAVFLRYLASGDSYRSIAYSYRMGERTVSKIINDVSTAIWKTMQPLYLPEPTQEMWENIAEEFQEKWNFPHCLGSLDGKHIMIKKPPKSGSSYINYKQYFSIVLMASVDANYKFTSVDIGSMGRFSDGNIFATSVLAKRLMKHTLNIPSPALLPTVENTNNPIPVPYVFVGDEAFPLLENLMRPFPKKSVTGNLKNKIFNYRLSRVRQTVECAFGILAMRFRVFRKPFESKIDSVNKIIKAACILHNYLRKSANSNKIDYSGTELFENQLLPLKSTNCRTTASAFSIRESFSDYFNSTGSVSWQESSVCQGKY